MKNKQLLKYKIGLLVIGLFTLALLVVVLVQSSATKQDAQTDKLANSMADSLNNYTDSNATSPATLSQAGIHKTSPYIAYTRLSDSTYKFCVTYKATSSNFDPSAAVNTVLTNGSGLGSDSTGVDSGANSDLYIPASHHKGVNCQTVDISTSVSGGSGCGLGGAAGAESMMCPVQELDNGSSTTTTCGQAYDASSEQSIVVSITAADIQIASPGVTPYTLPITPSAKFFDANCHSITLSDIHVGDTVTVFSGMKAGGVVAIQESAS